MALAADAAFWNHTLDGLAVLGGPDLFNVYRLQRPVHELAVVADSFHIKPLVRIMQSADRYQVLALNRREIKLFEGNRDVLDKIALAPGVPQTITEALGEELTEPHQTVASYGQGPAGCRCAMAMGVKWMKSTPIRSAFSESSTGPSWSTTRNRPACRCCWRL